MAHLAIKGHATRGNEVIALLEMLGGVNSANYSGKESDRGYYIEIDRGICFIDSIVENLDFREVSLEQFFERFPYKVGDKVKNMSGVYGKVYAMKWIDDEIQYRLDFGHHTSGWYGADELQPFEEKESIKTITIYDFKANTKEWLIDKLHDMLIVNAVKAIGDLHEELHKPQYPKTYEECCDVLIPDCVEFNVILNGYNSVLLEEFGKLLICRDAYWKLADNWKPDWNNISDKHCIYVVGKEMWSKEWQTRQCTLAFPTAEIRDAFYENFKDLIEQCKELL